ncbi:MAG: hypothetical protein JWO65_2257, partial [Sphingomonas bacterium]|nr:hypothetical protein [Sphingomonas bacterium]
AGGADNFLSDLSLARLRIADDIFGTFLPIYVGKLQAWLIDVLGWLEFDPAVVGENGATRIITSNFEVRLDWYRATLFVTEVYFERHHDRAHEAIQRLARTALDGLNTVHVRTYPPGTGEGFDPVEPRLPDQIARRGRELSVSGPLTENRRYTIYAKDAGRLRLELKYKGLPGAKEHPVGVPPMATLLHRLEAARRSSLTDMRWANVGAMLEPVPPSGAERIVELVSAVAAATASHKSELSAAVLRELLTDGGIAEDGHEIDRDLLDRLERRGVIEYRPARIRERRGTPRRYLLASEYRAVREALLESGDHPHEEAE